MRIWTVTVGEPLPDDPGKQRLLRTGILSPILVDRGHIVTWWTSTFDHVLKRQRYPQDRVVELGASYRMRLLHGCGYSRNVSMSRLIDHWQIARKFRSQAHCDEVRPDIIVCSFPTIELSFEAIRFGKRTGIPVVLDARDMWPDIFPPLAPAFARPLARAALWPYFRLSRLALRNASAIVGITDEFVEWGLKCAGRERTQWDRAFPMGYPSAQPTESEQQRARELWRSRGVTADDSKFKIAFAGTIGRQFEFEAALEAARLLGPEFQFILCGAGDRYADLQSLCRDVPNVILTGWIGADEIWTLMRIANVGLAPYHSEESFTLSLPNKSLEYLSAGMPVVSSLSGTLERLLAEQRCGFTYPNRDAAALAAFLKRLRLEPRLYAEMAANANRLFDARFRAEAVYSEMAEHLENLVSAKRY